MKTCPAVKTR